MRGGYMIREPKDEIEPLSQERLDEIMYGVIEGQ